VTAAPGVTGDHQPVGQPFTSAMVRNAQRARIGTIVDERPA
jgi:hypothetical protein